MDLTGLAMPFECLRETYIEIGRFGYVCSASGRNEIGRFGCSFAVFDRNI